EYAARQRLMNSLGLMNEAIIESNYNELGCDGWEISAHGGSAPDHEPIQGHQYSNAAYKALNANLQRRIGTLSCKHTASPIILGVNSPQYTQAELKAFQIENAKGITYQGRHYTLYEATQQQRSCEASIRRQKYHCLADTELGDKEKLLTDQIKLNITREQYLRFSRAAGLPTQNERAQVAGFGRSEASKASAAYRKNTANNKAYSDREFSIKAVTEESIEAVPKIYGENFTDVQADNLQKSHRQLLHFVINEDLGMEAGVYLDKDMLPLTDFVLGEIGRLNMPPSTQSAKVFIHNHPSGELFSIDDISNFTTDANLDILTAVGNDGSLYMLEK
ncbi:MAG: phage minor capsid protein, partial [Oscillospiraceae bacterium]